MRWGTLLVVLFLHGGGVHAQFSIDSLRNHYIEEYSDKFFIWPALKQRSLSFKMGDRKGKEDKVEFNPNTTVSLGFGVYLFEAVFEFTAAIPVNEKSKHIFGESSARDIQANIITKKWGADVFYQKYSGFYIDDPRNQPPAGIPFPQRADVKTRNYGFSGIYIFNNRKFSLRSAYNYAERQRHSKGSLLFIGAINTFKVSADSALLNIEPQTDFGAGSDFKSLRVTTISAGPGYSYTLTKNKFFVNGTIGIAPAQNWVNYISDTGTERNDVSFNAITLFRIGVGYNANRFFGGIGYATQSRNVIFENMAVSNASTTFRMVFGYRFQEVGILKKQIWDFLPFKF